MCGRYTLLAKESELQDYFGIDEPIVDYEPSYNIAPSQQVLAVIHDGESKRIGHLQWGLVPHWAKDQKIGSRMINARSETAHEKPSFKKLMARKRCLIVADSFYEWENKEGNKQPHRIQVKDRNIFTFAGLWDRWEKDGKTLFTCTMLTKDSNEFMKKIHHRMPIILPKEKEDEWISPYVKNPKDAKKFLDQIDNVNFTAYHVSNYVNYAQNNDERCIVPLNK